MQKNLPESWTKPASPEFMPPKVVMMAEFMLCMSAHTNHSLAIEDGARNIPLPKKNNPKGGEISAAAARNTSGKNNGR